MIVRSEKEKTLADRFLRGDEKAFIEVYDRYWYKLFLASYRRIKNRAVAEELVQDVFLKLWEKRGTLHIDQLENYLFSSIRNSTIDFLNRQIVNNKYVAYYRVFTSLQGNTTEEMVELSQLWEGLEKGLHSLSGKSQEIFRLHRIDHWSVEKIARHLQLSEKTVHNHLTESQKFIRAYLQQLTVLLLVLMGGS